MQASDPILHEWSFLLDSSFMEAANAFMDINVEDSPEWNDVIPAFPELTGTVSTTGAPRSPNYVSRQTNQSRPASSAEFSVSARSEKSCAIEARNGLSATGHAQETASDVPRTAAIDEADLLDLFDEIEAEERDQEMVETPEHSSEESPEETPETDIDMADDDAMSGMTGLFSSSTVPVPEAKVSKKPSDPITYEDLMLPPVFEKKEKHKEKINRVTKHKGDKKREELHKQEKQREQILRMKILEHEKNQKSQKPMEETTEIAESAMPEDVPPASARTICTAEMDTYIINVLGDNGEDFDCLKGKEFPQYVDYEREQQKCALPSVETLPAKTKATKKRSHGSRTKVELPEIDYSNCNISTEIVDYHLHNIAYKPYPADFEAQYFGSKARYTEETAPRTDVPRAQYHRADFISQVPSDAGILYEHNDSFAAIYPYEPEYYRVCVDPVSKSRINSTKCGLCAYCPQPKFHCLSNSGYAQHLALYHGVYPNNFITPSPLLPGVYKIAKVDVKNTKRKKAVVAHERKGFFCPSCYECIEANCTKATSDRPLNKYLRHFRDCHIQTKDKDQEFNMVDYHHTSNTGNIHLDI